MRTPVAIAALTALTLGACATPRAYNRVDAQARPALNKMEGVLLVKQGEIGSDIVVSNLAAQGGLIQAMIDAGINSSRTNKAEEAIIPIRDKLIDHDFAAAMESELEKAFRASDISGLSDIALVRAEDENYRQNTVKGSSADAVMFIDTTYKVSPKFDMILVKSDVKVFPTNSALNAYKEKPDDDDNMVEHTDNIYRNSFQSSASLDLVADMETNAAEAANLPASKFISALNTAATNIAQKIAKDLMTDDVEEE